MANRQGPEGQQPPQQPEDHQEQIHAPDDWIIHDDGDDLTLTEGSSSQNKGPTPQEIALQKKVELHTASYQLVSSIAGAFFNDPQNKITNQTHARDWNPAVRTLGSAIGELPGGNNPLYVRKVEHVEEALRPHREELLRLLNTAVNRYLERSSTTFQLEALYSGRGSENIIVPENIVDAVVTLQKEQQSERSAALKEALNSSIEVLGEFSEPFREHKKDQLADIIEERVAALIQIQSLMNGEQISLTDSWNYKYGSPDEEKVNSVKQKHSAALGALEQRLRDAASIGKPSRIDEAYIKAVSRALSRSASDKDLQSLAMIVRTERDHGFGRESYRTELSVEPTEDALFQEIVGSTYRLAILRDFHTADEHIRNYLPWKLTTWFGVPDAKQHIEFLMEKAFSDPEFFQKYPNVVGQGLASTQRNRLITLEDFPPEWVRPIPTHCGTITPEFVYRTYPWGTGVSTHYEQIAD